MVVNQKVTGRAASMPAGIGIGLGICMLITLTGCAIIAALINGERMPESSVGYGAMAVLLLSSVVGALTASGLVKRRRLVVCAVLGLCYFAVLLLINGLMFGGAVSGVGVTALLILGGCAAAAFLTARGEGKSTRRRRKLRTG